MKAYLSIKFHADDRNRDTIEALSSVMAAAGIETLCVRRDLERWGAVTLSPHELMTKTFEMIRLCQFVVVDLTEKGVGIGIEAGYARALSIPIITIAKEGADISETLRGISEAVHFYQRPQVLSAVFARIHEASRP